MSTPNPNYLIPFGPSANCTLEICPLEWSVFRYQPSIPANATILAMFGILFLVHTVQGIWYKTYAYMGCILAGCVLQVVGYVGRIMLHDNPFDFNAFLMQISMNKAVEPDSWLDADQKQSVLRLLPFSTAPPITHADLSISRFNPKLFYWMFIPADLVCLVLQATGGALSATGSNLSAVATGVDVSKAGLILQVIVLVIFLSLSADYLIAYRRGHKGELPKRTKKFLLFMFLAVLLTLIRCIYRIVELGGGYFGPNFRHQPEFIGLEGV
ncbi:hypothetical protein N0V90_009507 [Kalmusia sp. IMI 367209]|nr:hypothetical protein N0V90_009507 [Kalmusia sp. IMI 367209]